MYHIAHMAPSGSIQGEQRGGRGEEGGSLSVGGGKERVLQGVVLLRLLLVHLVHVVLEDRVLLALLAHAFRRHRHEHRRSDARSEKVGEDAMLLVLPSTSTLDDQRLAEVGDIEQRGRRDERQS
jgi:hypothetical protein